MTTVLTPARDDVDALDALDALDAAGGSGGGGGGGEGGAGAGSLMAHLLLEGADPSAPRRS
ncbi:MAG: hypothetical protein WEC34_16515 [Acidimicrobiia bacterium]